MPKFIDHWVDNALERDPAWTPETERESQCQRLVRDLAMCEMLIAAPTRWPVTESRLKRSWDKKLARQVAVRLATVHRQFGGQPADIAEYASAHEDELRHVFMTLDWQHWWDEHRVKLHTCMRHIASQARFNSYDRDGNRMLNSLVNEHQSLDQLIYSFVEPETAK